MKKLGTVMLGFVMALSLAAGTGAQKKGKEKEAKAAPGDPAKGEAVFKEQNCTVCHWPDKDTKRIGPGLKGLFTHKKMWDEKPFSEAAVREMILKGGGKMTGFEEQLKGKDLDNLVAFLKTL